MRNGGSFGDCRQRWVIENGKGGSPRTWVTICLHGFGVFGGFEISGSSRLLRKGSGKEQLEKLLRVLHHLQAFPGSCKGQACIPFQTLQLRCARDLLFEPLFLSLTQIENFQTSHLSRPQPVVKLSPHQLFLTVFSPHQILAKFASCRKHSSTQK